MIKRKEWRDTWQAKILLISIFVIPIMAFALGSYGYMPLCLGYPIADVIGNYLYNRYQETGE